MDAIPTFPFYLKVRVRSPDPRKKEIDGRLGYIAGITESPNDDGHFGYGIFIYDLARVWCCDERELESTGEMDIISARNAENKIGRAPES
jgi:Immunity protein 31